MRTDFEHLQPEDVQQMLDALLRADEAIQEAKDLVNKYGQGGMFNQEEIDSHMRHTAQLFRLHRVGHTRIYTLASKVNKCIHCGYEERSHTGKDKKCPYRYGDDERTTFKLNLVRFDALKRRTA